jgi:hypothetical protein
MATYIPDNLPIENAGLSDFLAVILKRNPSKEKNVEARSI